MDTTTRLDAIREQRARVVAEQEARDAAVAAETRKLAQLIDEGSTDTDAPVSYERAAQAMGVTKTYAYGLVKKLRAGKL